MNETGAGKAAGDSGPRRGLPRASRYRHPVNQTLVEQAAIGQRVADVVTNFLGSWTFIIIQTAVVAFWVVGNIYLLFHFDPYPFIFLNLAFSTQAAYAAPLILLASNRAAVRDRMTLEHAAMQTDVEENQNERLLNGVSDVLQHVDAIEHRILALEQRILELEQGIMARISSPSGAPVDPSVASAPAEWLAGGSAPAAGSSAAGSSDVPAGGDGPA